MAGKDMEREQAQWLLRKLGRGTARTVRVVVTDEAGTVLDSYSVELDSPDMGRPGEVARNALRAVVDGDF